MLYYIVLPVVTCCKPWCVSLLATPNSLRISLEYIHSPIGRARTGSTMPMHTQSDTDLNWNETLFRSRDSAAMLCVRRVHT